MKKRKILLGIALAAAAVFSLASCGDKPTPENTTGKTAETSGDTQVTKYTIKFMNGNTEVDSKEVEKNSIITAPTTNPTKDDDVSSTYSFIGWFTAETGGTKLTAETKASDNATYYAQYEATPRKYSIAFVVGETTVETKEINYGEAITAPTTVPTKDADNTNTYVFAGWFTAETDGTQLTNDTKVNGAATYYAHFTPVAIEYNVIFMNGDEAFDTKTLGYDEAIVAPTSIPTKDEDDYATYEFDGWYTAATDGEKVTDFGNVKENPTIFYAHFTATPKEYSIKFMNGDAEYDTKSLNYDAVITAPTTNPTKESTNEYIYTFAGWFTEATGGTQLTDTTKVTGAATYYAQFTQSDREYSIKFMNDDAEFDTQSLKYDATITAPATDPTKAETDDCTYTFAGWFTEATGGELVTDFGKVSGNATFYAQFTEVDKIKVTFVNGIDSTEVKFAAGATITAPATDPTKAETDDEYFVFAGWFTAPTGGEKLIETTKATANVTYYAQFETKDKVVDLDGKKYSTIAKALAAIPTSGTTDTYTITLPKGTYNENHLVYNGSATVKIVGDTTTKYGADVVIKGHGDNMASMRSRELLEIQGTGNVILVNLTLESDWSRKDHTGDVQAEVLGTDTKGNTVAYNCGFKSHQDTIRTAGKAWFYGCYIEGDTDFMWMEAAGTVALYEKCEIVSVYDENASTHRSYLTAPRMAVSTKVGKGLVIYNSTVKEQNADQETYLARTPWNSGYYNQVAYINTTCEGIESKIWYNNQIATEFAKTVIGWKMDQFTADSIGYAGNDDIVDDTTVDNEFSGRETILNRIYNTGKQKYELDSINYWDINAVIDANGFVVDTDTSKSVLDNEEVGVTTIYNFDGTEDVSALCNGFAQEGTKAHYKGGDGSTITIPVTGKCYVEVYGYYSGTAEIKADTQGEAVVFFNNATTSAEVINTYAVYDANATSVVITSKATTYITKIVVTTDSSIENKEVTSIAITGNTTNYSVGVSLNLTATINPTDATNKTVKWTSNNEAVGKINQYTGKVTFVAAGTVTFTATATDGSGVSQSITCNPIAPTWTSCEWYTTDGIIDSETGCDGIGNFSYASGTNNKQIKNNAGENQSYTFTNLAGQTITTRYGLKLNGSGKMYISTTKAPAVLTFVIGKHQNLAVQLGVEDEAGNELTPTSVTQDGDLTTYVYELNYASTWTIYRGKSATNEGSPIIYAKCEYVTNIAKNTFVNYKGGTYSAQGENAVAVNHNNEASGYKLDGTEVTYNNFTYKNVSSNGTDNWVHFDSGSTITFTAKSACTLYICFYNGSNNATVTLNGTEVKTSTDSTGADHKTRYAYTISAGGTVTISGNSNGGYIGCLEVTF